MKWKRLISEYQEFVCDNSRHKKISKALATGSAARTNIKQPHTPNVNFVPLCMYPHSESFILGDWRGRAC